MSEKADPILISPTDKPVFVATTVGGHTMAITPEGTAVPKRFQSAAFQAGCVPESMRESLTDSGPANTVASPMEIIIAAIDKLVTDAQTDPERARTLLTTDGRPDCMALSTFVGFPVKAAQRDEAWEAYQAQGDD